MRHLTNSEKIGATAIILNVVVFSLCFLLFRDIQKRSITISTISNELDQVSEKQSQYLSFKDIINETKEERAKIDSFFVSNDGAVGFLELIEDQGRLSNSTTTIVSVRTEDDKLASSTVEILELELEVGAKWQDLYYFLSLLENLPYNITFKNVVIKKVEDRVNYWETNFVLQALKLKK